MKRTYKLMFEEKKGSVTSGLNTGKSRKVPTKMRAKFDAPPPPKLPKSRPDSSQYPLVVRAHERNKRRMKMAFRRSADTVRTCRERVENG